MPAYRILQLNSARKFVGEAAHTLNLTEALRAAGHHVWLGLREGFETIETARSRLLDPLPFRMSNRWWFFTDGPDLKQIARLVRQHRIQLIHAHRGKDHWQAVIAKRLFGLRIPIVRTRHVVTPLRNNLGNRWLARQTARIVAVSSAVQHDILRSELFSPEFILKIPGGIDPHRFAPKGQGAETRASLGISVTSPVAICVARFAIVKAHEILIDAWHHVCQQLPDAMLLLIGGMRERENQIKAQAERLGLQHRVRFLGKQPNERIPALLEASDLGVLASIGSEGFSRAVLEYMSMSLPVVGTTVGAMPDLIMPEQNGILVPPSDPKALAQGILKCFALSTEQRRSWGAVGRKLAETRYSYAAWSQTHAELYRDVLYT